jgi:hypothetical protein
MISGYRAKVAAGMIVACVLASSLGVYLALNLPSQAPSGSQLLVYSNRVVVYTIPGFNSTFSEGIWQLELGNGGSSALYATYQLFANGYLGAGNTTMLQPGQRASETSCLIGPVTPSTRFDVPIFVTNSTGIVVPHYPVMVVNTTQKPFSGQFSTTSILRANVYDPLIQQNASLWNISVSNTGNEAIQFLQATLWNGTELIESPQLHCAGSMTYLKGFPQDYGQPLSPGDTANGTGIRFMLPPSVITAGSTYRVVVIAVYSDYSEIVQVSEVQAAP